LGFYLLVYLPLLLKYFTMSFITLATLPSKPLLPGFEAQFIHTENLTIGYINIREGSILPEHSHMQEQVTHVLEGQLEMTVGGETFIVEKGKVAVIPSNIVHSAKALTNCIALDVFSPTREDYK
jgi:quercetin dioxygenase-like cupin family protein